MPSKDMRKKSKGCWPSLTLGRRNSKKLDAPTSGGDNDLSSRRTSNHITPSERPISKSWFKIPDKLLPTAERKASKKQKSIPDHVQRLSVDSNTKVQMCTNAISSNPKSVSGRNSCASATETTATTHRGTVTQQLCSKVNEICSLSLQLSNANDIPNCAMLSAAVEHCDRRLERLYGRLIWLRNLGDISAMGPYNSLTTSHSMGQTEDLSRSSKLNFQSGLQVDESPPPSVEHQISCISARVQQLKKQLESHDFLSWLSLIESPPTRKVAHIGKNCAPPNPQLHLIRRPDATTRATIDEYTSLCATTVPEKARLSLRETTFNNWPWADAWLIRFVRQMFFDLDLVTHFNLSVDRLDIWLCDVYRRYNRVPFHNYKHAFMVTQMAYAILWSAKLKDYLTSEDQLILLMSTICHDLDHPGFNNAYQINAGTELAVRYNDQSPLENHHSATAFDILTNTEANLLAHLDRDTFRRIRDGMIRCILATDMSRHNDILTRFNEVVLANVELSRTIDTATQKPMWCSEKNKLDLFMMILIKLCDISNEARPLNVSEEWIDRLLAEFFNQSDYEKMVGLPVAPFMDRDNVTKAASQCGFIRFVILPLYKAVAKLIPELEDVIVKPVIVQLDYYTNVQKENEQSESVENDSASADTQDQLGEEI